jgi:hypothetical protein
MSWRCKHCGEKADTSQEQNPVRERESPEQETDIVEEARSSLFGE